MRFFNKRQKNALRLLSGNSCSICGIKLSSTFHADHITPYSKGGKTTIKNGQALCKTCNLQKGNKIMKTYNWKERQWQGEARQKCMDWFLDKSIKIDCENRNKFLVNAAPGSGKTSLSCNIAKILFEKNEIEQVIIIAPTTKVVQQWEKDFSKFTSRPMIRVTGNNFLDGQGFDICATWAAVKNAQGGLQLICEQKKTLVICDEQHHAAVKAAWGNSAESAFNKAKFVLILSGTPIRSDSQDALWMPVDSEGEIKHPIEGIYTLTYGEAVDLGYCRPVTFSKEEGKFRYMLAGETIANVSSAGVNVENDYKGSKILSDLDLFRSAKKQIYLKNGLPDPKSYPARMVFSANEKLEKVRENMPDAGGLIIVHRIEMAEYMAKIISIYLKDEPIIVHSDNKSSSNLIDAFKRSNKKWLVSVKMVSEGVDIDRLRVMAYLPKDETELFFRQAMGRIVRSRGLHDDSYAYVVMPFHQKFIEYAKRVRNEMSPKYQNPPALRKNKKCPICETEVPRGSSQCTNIECGYEFPVKSHNFFPCHSCDHLNPYGTKHCENCGETLQDEFTIQLDDHYRDGGVSNGKEISEQTMKDAEEYDEILSNQIDRSSTAYYKWYKTTTPEERLEMMKDVIALEKGENT